MDNQQRFDRCVVAVSGAMDRAAAEIVCAKAVYESRGLRTTRTRTSSRRRTASRRRSTGKNQRNKNQ